MFKEELSQYIDLTEPQKAILIFDTISSYEFSMQAIGVESSWYALVANADWTRVSDINEVINEEFDAETEGWCVLKDHQQKLKASTLPFADGESHHQAITYNTGSQSYWLLKIRPRTQSRLSHV